ncbi:MAG: hypothetical protein ABI674_04555 [Spartobacteria bacterium]
MPAEDRNRGSIKVLIILVLLFANIVLSFSHRRVDPPPPGSARASRAVFGALAENFPNSSGSAREAREARALPGQPTP